MLDFKSFTENLGATLRALTPRGTVPLAVTGWVLLTVNAVAMPLPGTVTVAALVVAVLCTSFVATSAVAALSQYYVLPKYRRYRDQQRIEGELAFLTEREREILGHLLAHNQRAFEVLPDGEEAATLIAKGFVRLPARHAPAIHRDITVEVPPHVWEVLARHRTEFPQNQSADRGHPWRTPWMAR